MALKMTWTSRIDCHCRRLVARFVRDTRGLAAVEFAFIVPLMLTLMFGTIDVSSGVAIDRKVTLTARSLSDLVSQGSQVKAVDLKNFFGMGSAVMAPYSVTALTLAQKISAINVDATKKATVAWSYTGTVNAGVATLGQGDTPGAVVTSQIPQELLVPNTQLIWSVVTYTYTPIVGYVIKGSIPLTDQCFTRPRQSDTVTYSAT